MFVKTTKRESKNQQYNTAKLMQARPNMATPLTSCKAKHGNTAKLIQARSNIATLLSSFK